MPAWITTYLASAFISDIIGTPSLICKKCIIIMICDKKRPQTVETMKAEITVWILFIPDTKDVNLGSDIRTPVSSNNYKNEKKKNYYILFIWWPKKINTYSLPHSNP